MDISSLLSPQDSPASETPPAASPQLSPNRRAGRTPKRKSSGLIQQLTHSPPASTAHANALPSIAAHNSAFQASANPFQGQQALQTPNITLQPQAAVSPGMSIKPHALPSPGIAALQAQQALPSPGLLSPGLLTNARAMSVSSAVNTPTSEPRGPIGTSSDARLTPSQPSLRRQGSTAGMDTLAGKKQYCARTKELLDG